MSARLATRLGLAALIAGAAGIAPACSEDEGGGREATVSADASGAPPQASHSAPGLPAPGPAVDAAPPCTPSPQAAAGGAVDVEVSVRADRGPNGTAKPAVVDRKLLGMNIADWRPEEYTPPNPKYLALLSALRPGVLRWPAGHRSQEYVWQRGGEGQHGSWTLTPAQIESFMALAKTVDAEPLLAINVKTGTPAAAADLVRYVNKERNHGVKWFQVVNEPDLTDGIIPSPDAFALQLIAFVDAMRAVDPGVQIVSPELLTGAHVLGIHAKVNWLLPVVLQAGDRMSGISWHYYPLDSGQSSPTSSATMSVPHLFQEVAPDWRPAGLSFVDEIMPALASIRNEHAPNAGIWVTEFAEDPGPGSGAGLSDTMAGALWVADALGRYARHAPAAVLRWLFKGSDEHAYGLLDPQNNPRPTYGTYWLYARHVGRSFVDTQSSALTEVNAHAALRDDGALTVIFVNKSPMPRRVRVSLSAYGACTADELSLEGVGVTAPTFQINGQSLSADTADGKIAPRTVDPSRLFDVELPPASVRVIAYRR